MINQRLIRLDMVESFANLNSVCYVEIKPLSYTSFALSELILKFIYLHYLLRLSNMMHFNHGWIYSQQINLIILITMKDNL